MVLEILINPQKLKGRKWEMFLMGVMYSFISAFLALWIFKSYSSIVMITLTIVACIPIVRKVIEIEEKKDFKIKGECRLLKEHGNAISMLTYLFLGLL